MAAMTRLRPSWLLLLPLWMTGSPAHAAAPDGPEASYDAPAGVLADAAGPCRRGAVDGAVFAAPDGDDAQDGTADRPVLTLDRVLGLLINTDARTAYLRGGTYLLAQPAVLGAGHAGVRLLGCPGERPVLQGARDLPDALVVVSDTRGVTVAGLAFGPTTPGGSALILDRASDCLIADNHSSDAGTAILLDHARGNRLQWNVIRNAARTGIELRDASDDNLVEANWINGAGGPETHGGGIFLHGTQRNRIASNLVENAAGMGIGIANWDAATINLGNAVIGNTIRRVNLTATDSGAIYLLGRSQLNTRTLIAANWVDGVGAMAGGALAGRALAGAPGLEAQRHNVGIYLDDSTSGAVVVGNVVRNVRSDAVQIHGGSDNLVANNILDLGPGAPSAVLFQAAPADTNPTNAQRGNEVTRNIIVSASPAPKVYVWIEGGQPLIRRNLYYNALGASMAGSLPVADTDPILAGPGFADALGKGYALAGDASVALIGFHPLAPPRLPAMARNAGQ